jgi:dTDP-4-dehydrorhamnose 3,5-epimerase
LSADESNALCVPPGCAHGFLTLDDATEVFYSMGAPYAADLGRGVRWDDRAFGIEWPLTPTVMSSRDRDYPDFTP